jgi:outer membrane protein assembly factor BamB
MSKRISLFVSIGLFLIIILSLVETTLAVPTVAISSPTSNPAYSTNQVAVAISGTASTTTGNVASMSWDNVNTGDAGMMTITPSASVSWNTVSIPLKPGTNEIQITAIDTQGYASTGRLTITRTSSGPIISGINVNSTSVRVYEKYEISFDLSTAADYPLFQYDTAPPAGLSPGLGVTVQAVITTPSGGTVRQPAFYYTETANTGSGSNPVFVQGSRSYWKVRYSPQEAGTYQVTLSAQDKSGTANAAVGSFTATSPIKKGFIKVSSQDSRYFEFSDGELYWPIGPARGNNYAQYSNTGQNLERPWMGGSGAYSTNWARWMSSAEQLGNEGYMARLSYLEHYPTHELSYELFYPAGFRIWISNWMDDSFGARVKASTQYQVKLRVKTINMSGPRVAGQPYGLAFKNHGWLSWSEDIDTVLRPSPSWVDRITTNRDWHTIVQRFTTSSSVNNDFSIYLENVNSGSAYVDELSIREVLANGSLGGELIRQPRADMHSYVEQRPAAFFDWQQAQGDQNGVFFKYVVHDKNDWIQNHLTSAGIFAATGDGYYQAETTKARWLLRQWYTYLIARWGYSTQVHSWELNNEGPPNDDPPGSGSAPHWRTAEAFAKFMHDNNPQPQMATTSFWCCWRPEFWGNEQSFPDLDYADIHQYTVNDPLGYDMAEWTNTASMAAFADHVGKPVMRGETGISDANWLPISYLTQANSGIWYHNLLWAELNPGAMSEPNYWYSEHLDVINRMQVSKPFYDFTKALDLNKGGYVDAVAATTNANIRIYGQKNLAKNKAQLWIQNKDHTWRNVMWVANPVAISPQSGTITLRMNPSTAYQANWYNTYAGTVSSTQTLSSDAQGNLQLTITNLADDIAVSINSSGPGSGPPANNTPPTITLTSPMSGASYLAPANITLTATATDTDGTITKVEFYQGSSLINTDTTFPYTYTVNNLPMANYSFQARAYDNNNSMASSSTAIVSVRNSTNGLLGDVNQDGSVNLFDLQLIVNDFGKTSGFNPVVDIAPSYGLINLFDLMVVVKNWGMGLNQPPSIAITSPSNGATVSGVITVSATATDSSGVAGVQFLLDSTSLGSEDTASPYSMSWNTSTASNGAHTLGARARDGAGSTNPTQVSIVINNTIIQQPADTTPPVRTSGQPTGSLPAGTTSATVSLSTDETARCRYSANASASFQIMTAFATTGGTSHSTSLTGLTNGTSYSYYIKCNDTSGNVNPDNFAINFNVGAPLGTTTNDWTQLQKDSQHTGRTSAYVDPDYKLTWAWIDKSHIVHNFASATGTSVTAGFEPGFKFNVIFSGTMQPVVAGGRAYFGDMNGVMYAVDALTGDNSWDFTSGGPILATAAYSNGVLIFGSMDGKVYGLNAVTGSLAWSYQTGAGISAAPTVGNGVAYVGSRDGYFYAIDATSGSLRWRYATRDTTNQYFSLAPIFMPAAISEDGSVVMFGAENLDFYALNTADGTEKWAPKKLIGQSFQFGWPMVKGNKVIVRTMSSMTGAEEDYAPFEAVLDGLPANPTWTEEKAAIMNVLTTSPEQKTMYVFDIDTGAEPYQVAMGRVTGNNYVAHISVVDNSNRVLTYWRSKHATLFNDVAGFGSSYCPDVSAMDMSTGDRVALTVPAANKMPCPELDNGFQPTIGGNWMYMTNHFRGVKAVNLVTGASRGIASSTAVRDCSTWRGGNCDGCWGFQIIYYGNDAETETCQIAIPKPAYAYESTQGFAGAAIASTNGRTMLYVNEGDGSLIAAIEHK